MLFFSPQSSPGVGNTFFSSQVDGRSLSHTFHLILDSFRGFELSKTFLKEIYQENRIETRLIRLPTSRYSWKLAGERERESLIYMVSFNAALNEPGLSVHLSQQLNYPLEME